jgi:vacuolar-type H+-ATPase subunit H
VLSGTTKTLFALLIFATASTVLAQAPVATINLGADQIGKVRTAQGISTRISFPEPVSEVICGDLYDASTGKGLFVVQRSGDEQNPGNAVYLKPIAAKGVSNLFVTTVGKARFTYNFDLEIVPIGQAHRVVNVITPASNDHSSGSNGVQNGGTDFARAIADIEQRRLDSEQLSKRQSDDIIRNARQQADRIINEAETRANNNDRQAAQKAEQEAERRFVRALLMGLREVKIDKTRTAVGRVAIVLDPRMLILDDKCYLRYTIQNTGETPFGFNALTLEKITGEESQRVAVDIHQSKTENRLEAGEVMAGVLVFESKAVGPKEKLGLFVRAADNSELARLTVQ